MKNVFVIILVVFILSLITAGALTIFKFKQQPQRIACTLEAKLCPDGSAVGRTGPKCEFAPCPDVKETTTVRINQKILNHGIYITPLEVISDSRCPVDVQCIWAGTLELRVKLESGDETEEATLTLNTPLTFMEKQVQLVSVDPAPYSKKVIAEEEYTFNFQVTP